MLRKLVAVGAAVVVAATFAVASAMASENSSRISVAKRTKGTSPPPLVITPPPDTPSPPPDDRGPGPGPVEFAPPPAAPPLPAAPPEVPVPPPVSPGPTPTSFPAENVGPDETVRPPLGRPDDAPVRLPQTGAGSRPLTATGGVSLLAAGLAVIAGARRSAAVSQPVRRR